jgi:hypothetical protein
MANRFLNNITINDQYTLPSNDGSAGQAIVTDGVGNLSFGSAVASSADSTESIHINVKNTSGSQILKGTPVYVTGETGNSGKIEIAPADASDSAKMPALGILESTLNDNAEGFCVQGGLLEGLATATIDGTSTTANDTVYVKAGGGLTMTKPTGSNLIQNIAKVARVHASNGSLVVSSILRTNDVPNLPTGKIWVGDGNTTISTVVHLDESNGRMGIGTTSPQSKLHIETGSGGTYNPNVNHDDVTIEGSGNIGLQLFSPATTYQYIAFGDPDSVNAGYIRYYHGNNNMIFRTNGGDNMIIDSSGNVGIGTTNPSVNKLQVNGQVRVVGAQMIGNSTTSNLVATGVQLHLKNSGEARLRLEDTDSDNLAFDLIVNEGSGFSIRETVGGGPGVDTRLFIEETTGYVGIGTTSPGQKLDVNGNVKITETAATSDTDKFVVLDSGVLKYRTGSQIVSDVIVAPNAPTNLTTTIVNSTINVTFTASTTSGIDYYLVFSSVDGGDYGLISVIPPDDFGATMSIIDDSFDASGTQAYRVYAVKYGVYSSALTGNISFSVTTPLEPTNMSVVSLNTAYYVQWDPPSANARFVTAYNVYKHEHATQGSLSRSSATLIYSGLNTSYMYQISGANNGNFHQFWVETTVA